MNKLGNKIVVVTGGSGLLGRSIITDLKSKGAIAINAEINADDGHEYQVYCDVTDEKSIEECIAIILAKYGRIDGWVNNAYPRTADWGNKFEDIPAESWRRNVDSQLNSVFLCSKAVLEVMKRQSSGSLVNVSSIYGSVGPDFSVYDGTAMTMPAAYSAIKGGVLNFSRYLASYFGPFGVRVNCISPGGIFDHQTERFVTQYEQKVPMKRMGTPADIAGPVSFLISDESGYITGHNLMVDGGWTAI